MFKIIILSRHICATDVGKGACKGDSGGPLFLPENGRYGSWDTHSLHFYFLNPGIQWSELEALGMETAEIFGFQRSSQESHLWKSGSWKIRMEHRTVIVHLILDKWNVLNQSQWQRLNHKLLIIIHIILDSVRTHAHVKIL